VGAGGLQLRIAARWGEAVRRRDAGLLAAVVAIPIASAFDGTLLSGSRRLRPAATRGSARTSTT
jgi:hypothetical protein